MHSIFGIFETFVVVDMDGSFPMRRYTLCLDSWFKIMMVLKISAKLRA
jgi:hypothetical protein